MPKISQPANWCPAKPRSAPGHSRPIDTPPAVATCPLCPEKRTNTRSSRYDRLVPIADLPGSIRVFAVYPTNQSSRHFEPMRQPSEGSVVVLYRPCLIRETQLELERRSCQSCSEVRRKLMRSMSSRY